MKRYKEAFICQLLRGISFPTEVSLMIAKRVNRRDVLRLATLNRELNLLAMEVIYHSIEFNVDMNEYRSIHKTAALLGTLLVNATACRRVRRFSVNWTEVYYEDWDTPMDPYDLVIILGGTKQFELYKNRINQQSLPEHFAGRPLLQRTPTAMFYTLIGSLEQLTYLELGSGPISAADDGSHPWRMFLFEVVDWVEAGRFRCLKSVVFGANWAQVLHLTPLTRDIYSWMNSALTQVPALTNLETIFPNKIEDGYPSAFTSLTRLRVPFVHCDTRGLNQVLTVTPHLRNLECDLWNGDENERDEELKDFLEALQHIKNSLEELFVTISTCSRTLIKDQDLSRSSKASESQRPSLRPMKRLSSLTAPLCLMLGQALYEDMTPIWDQKLPGSLRHVTVIDEFGGRPSELGITAGFIDGLSKWLLTECSQTCDFRYDTNVDYYEKCEGFHMGPVIRKTPSELSEDDELW